MTTLSVPNPRPFETGERNEYPVVATDIIYEGAAVGLVKATGLARPLVGGDGFGGFAETTADNATGGAGAIRVRVIESGKVELAVPGASVADLRQPVYATDDNAFSFSPVGATFIGFVHRWVAAGIVVVAFDATRLQDPYAGWVHEVKSANFAVDAEDAGKMLWVDTDGVVVTLPAVEGIGAFRVANLGAFGAVGLSVSPNAADMIEGPDITGADNKDLINTKATAQRGDFVEIGYGDGNGWSVARLRGTWAREA